MPLYKITYTEYHRVSKEYSEEFDTSNVEQWDELKSRARDMMDDEAYSALPDLPPRDTDIWLELYKNISSNAYKCDAVEDWITDRKGGYDSEWIITDHRDTIVSEDSSY
jgi:hypothetical protein